MTATSANSVRPWTNGFSLRLSRGIAVAMTALAAASFVGTLLVAALWQPGRQSYAGWEGLWLASLFAYALVGGLIAGHRPRNPVGWLCLVGGVAGTAAALLDVLAVQSLVGDPGSLPGGVWMRWGQSVLFAISLTMIPLLPLLFFPDGRLPSRRWRPLLVASVLLITAGAVVAAFAPGPIGESVPVDNPLGVQSAEAMLKAFDSFVWPSLSGLTVVVLVSLIVRWRRASGQVRRQLSWLALAAVAAILAFVAGEVLSLAHVDNALISSGLLQVPMLLGVPVALGIAILRDGLFDVEVVLSRTLAYSVLTGLILLAYTATLLVASQFLRSSADVAVSMVATALLAVALSPLKDRLELGVDRWLYGERGQPYALLTSLGDRLQEVTASDRVLADLAELVRAGLRLPYVAVEVDRGDAKRHEAGGPPLGGVVTFPLTADGQRQGRLFAGLRSGENDFSAAERSLLLDVAGQIAVAARSVGLADELQRSRERLVAAREEERRRVRRDLHDGVGPVLAALTLQLDALTRRLGADDVEGRALAARMSSELKGAVGDIRRVVEGLRPPSLDELGLAGVVREHARAVSTGSLTTSVNVADDMALSPAVEVAAYRILTEAMTNVARHANATRCEVTARLRSDGLELQVRDNGHMTEGEPGGIGLSTMRERAAELGGTFELVDGPGGTTVQAWVPVGAR